MSERVTFCHGPGASPFVLTDNGGLVGDDGRLPFHGIISRGLLQSLPQESKSGELWADIAHRLHDRSDDGDTELDRWRDIANLCGVLRFDQSAECARRYALRLATEPIRSSVLQVKPGADEDVRIGLWNVKEGHTSSVWRVRWDWGTTAVECAINVARDRVAGEELKQTSRAMQAITNEWPEAPVACVRAIDTIDLPEIADPVVVTCSDWIAGAMELHRLPDGQQDATMLIAVERFIADEVHPSRICRIAGRRLEPVAAAIVERDLAEFLFRAEGLSIAIDINDGDLVWDGSDMTVVAVRQGEAVP